MGNERVKALDDIIERNIRIVYQYKDKDQAMVKTAQDNISKAIRLRCKLLGIEVPQL